MVLGYKLQQSYAWRQEYILQAWLIFKTTVKFRDNSEKSVVGIGTISIQTKENNTHKISDIFFVLDLKTKLISVG